MIKDECILVDEADNVTGHANKYQSHRCAQVDARCLAVKLFLLQGFKCGWQSWAALSKAGWQHR